MCVCECECENRRSTDAIRPQLKSFFFSAELRLDATSGSLPAKALEREKEPTVLRKQPSKLEEKSD